ncbi:hypothetical protein SISSUDRAFT_1055439 [Sistotremastrum suecicum HHB10207 ss-3]|uniref:Uncharacterized protein n=1 Tax=Sistotremastrum suecicum HHB10207 ss-3 TaxID=1314776 RepID=A0A165XSS0_9AGAM|nr:hypothetical protein SISSUDRAFT_1055439 [Sistotremastrum suecicum HHB10207 ss-3]
MIGSFPSALVHDLRNRGIYNAAIPPFPLPADHFHYWIHGEAFLTDRDDVSNRLLP